MTDSRLVHEHAHDTTSNNSAREGGPTRCRLDVDGQTAKKVRENVPGMFSVPAFGSLTATFV